MRTLEEHIGQRIASLRRAYGMTQAQLAERVDVLPETISRIENGRRTASLALLARIADAIDQDLHELFRFNGADDPKANALDNLMWFASRLTAHDIDRLLDVATAVFKSDRGHAASWGAPMA